MTALNVKTQETLVSESTANIQGSASSLVDFTVGSILLAIVESWSAVVLWLQGLILGTLLFARASTSFGDDLDSWLAQFGFVREGAIKASGNVTFSRFTSTAIASLPVGSICQTPDGTQQFVVQADTSNPAYNALTQVYTLAIGVSSMTVPVLALVAGAGGNVRAGSIAVLSQAISGIDTVTNGASFTNGSDKESDSAVMARFVIWINSLSKGTRLAVIAAILGVPRAIMPSIVENQQYSNGLPQYGYFYAIVDDGTGTPDTDFMDAEFAAIDAVRPLSVGFSIFAPVVLSANITYSLQIAAGQDNSAIIAQSIASVTDYANSLSSGQTLSLTQIAKYAYQSSQYILDVTNVLINGSAVELASTNKQVIKAGTVGVT